MCLCDLVIIVLLVVADVTELGLWHVVVIRPESIFHVL